MAFVEEGGVEEVFFDGGYGWGFEGPVFELGVGEAKGGEVTDVG